MFCIPVLCSASQYRLKVRPPGLLRIDGSRIHVAIILATKTCARRYQPIQDLKLTIRHRRGRPRVAASGFRLLERCSHRLGRRVENLQPPARCLRKALCCAACERHQHACEAGTGQAQPATVPAILMSSRQHDHPSPVTPKQPPTPVRTGFVASYKRVHPIGPRLPEGCCKSATV